MPTGRSGASRAKKVRKSAGRSGRAARGAAARKTARGERKAKTSSRARAKARAAKAVSPFHGMSPGYVKALADYEKAMAAFHRRDLERAETLFQKVLDLHAAEAGDLADRSRVYLAACRKQTEQAERPRGFDDHYNQGIYHANRGEYREAAAMFEKALGLEPRSGKAHYALAAALAQLGEPARALDHLRRAVAADGANRRLARHDPDFGPLQDSPEFEEAITRTGPGG